MLDWEPQRMGNDDPYQLVVLLRTGAGIQHPAHSAMVHKPQEANGSFQPRDIFFPEEKESLSLPALLSEPVQGVLVHSG